MVTGARDQIFIISVGKHIYKLKTKIWHKFKFSFLSVFFLNPILNHLFRVGSNQSTSEIRAYCVEPIKKWMQFFNLIFLLMPKRTTLHIFVQLSRDKGSSKYLTQINRLPFTSSGNIGIINLDNHINSRGLLQSVCLLKSADRLLESCHSEAIQYSCFLLLYFELF